MHETKNETLTHVYGIASLVPGIVSVFYLVATGSSWREYALVASGWVAAIFYALMLVKTFAQARSDGEEIGTLKENVKSLEKELVGRNTLLEYLAGLQMGKVATPRVSPISNPSSEEPAHD